MYQLWFVYLLKRTVSVKGRCIYDFVYGLYVLVLFQFKLYKLKARYVNIQ